ncbi:hypothetical protein [uncultured Empedobacter sp.]|uniref:hypothetical protein n=1 Tax=uncultured Empedobacter sp. TaxID=410844 RepID=UPI0025F9D65D|nr:hypothetical protein [uncultured Empedobacter sp.]
MPTASEIKENNNTLIREKTEPNSIPTNVVANQLDAAIDYVDQQVPEKTSGSVTLSGTTQVLPNTINSCSFTNGKAYLPPTTTIGKEIYVIAVANGIEISANAAGTLKLFTTFNTFIANVTLTQYQMYRFVYIGFGTGSGGSVDGYWKAELL